MFSREIIERFANIVRPSRAETRDEVTPYDDAPAVAVFTEGDRVVVYITPGDLTPEARAEVWRVYAERATALLVTRIPGLTVRIVPPGDGQPGVLQYSIDGRPVSDLEARLLWAQVAAVLPETGQDATLHLAERWEMARALYLAQRAAAPDLGRGAFDAAGARRTQRPAARFRR